MTFGPVVLCWASLPRLQNLVNDGRRKGLISIVVASLPAGPCPGATIFALRSTAEVMATVRGLDAVAYINAPMLMSC